MYLDYWQLDAKPFEPNCETPFLFAGDAHKSARHKLQYAIESRRAAGLIAGPAGVGKTLLVETLSRELDDRCQPLVRVVFPQMTERDLLVYLAEHLGRRRRIRRDTRSKRVCGGWSMSCADVRAGRHAVIVVDEAQLLEDSGLVEPLRLLLNLTIDRRAPFTLLLVGQPTLLPMVARHGSLDERLDIKVFLPTFTVEETAAYVEHRLAAAGGEPGDLLGRRLGDRASVDRRRASSDQSALRFGAGGGLCQRRPRDRRRRFAGRA